VFYWLFEGWPSVYVLLLVLGVITAGMWSRNGFVLFQEKKRTKSSPKPDRRLALPPIVLVVVALLIGVYFLLDRLVETRREEIKRKVREMAAAVRTRNVDRIFSHISEQFHLQNMNRATFRGYVEAALENREVEELEVWDEQFPDDSGRVNFRAVPKGGRFGGGAQFLVRGQFGLDPDGQWRLRGFEITFGLGGDALTLPPIIR
jgi:hypothetical protein